MEYVIGFVVSGLVILLVLWLTDTVDGDEE